MPLQNGAARRVAPLGRAIKCLTRTFPGRAGVPPIRYAGSLGEAETTNPPASYSCGSSVVVQGETNGPQTARGCDLRATGLSAPPGWWRGSTLSPPTVGELCGVV